MSDAEWNLRHGHSPVRFRDGTVVPALTEEETDALIAFLDDQEGLDEACGHQRASAVPRPKAQRQVCC